MVFLKDTKKCIKQKKYKSNFIAPLRMEVPLADTEMKHIKNADSNNGENFFLKKISSYTWHKHNIVLFLREFC